MRRRYLTKTQLTTSLDSENVVVDKVTTPTVIFPASHIASTNLHTIDDYETGSFTPYLRFGGSSTGMKLDRQAGLYTKIGGLVNITMYLRLTAKGTSAGYAKIEGLPFSILNAGSIAALNIYSATITFANQLIFRTGSTSGGDANEIHLGEVTQAGVYTWLTNVDFSNASVLMLGLTYKTED